MEGQEGTAEMVARESRGRGGRWGEMEQEEPPGQKEREEQMEKKVC